MPASDLPVRVSTASRYQTGAGSRFLGILGAAAVAGIALCASLFTWQSLTHVPPPARLTVFDVAPPAAPAPVLPEPVSAPEKAPVKKPQPTLRQPRIAPPEIVLSGITSVPVLADAPAPPSVLADTEKVVPESRSLPPPQPSIGNPTWEGQVLGALNKVRRYPREARFARQQGMPYIRFVIDREGKVVSSRIERSSGIRSLDQEALALPRRAQPLPRPPGDVKGETIELVVPVEFFIR
ncbi:MAG: TonB family protein [Novosphingobium sp.]